jgi:hypothetical protein
MELVGQLEVMIDAEDGLGDLHGLPWNASRLLISPGAEAGDLLGPLVFGGEAGKVGVVMAAIEDTIDGVGERGGHVVGATGEDGSPGSIEEDVGDAGVAVQEDGNAALEGLDSGNAVALDGGHEEEMGLIVEGLELPVGDEAVEVYVVCDSELAGELGERGELRTAAGEVETPVCPLRERRGGGLEYGEGVKNPVDTLVVFDAADGEQAKLAAGLDGAEVKEAIGIGDCESTHARDVGFDVEVAVALVAQILASDHGVASAGKTVGDDAIGNGNAHVVGICAPGDVAEERRRVVHEGVEAAHAGEGGVQCGLIAGDERMRRTGRERAEVTAEGRDATARSGCGENDDRERVGCELREVATVGVEDDVAGEMALVQPAR